MANSKEAEARIKINKLLEKAGWRFFDDDKGQANIQIEPNVNPVRDRTPKASDGCILEIVSISTLSPEMNNVPLLKRVCFAVI